MLQRDPLVVHHGRHVGLRLDRVRREQDAVVVERPLHVVEPAGDDDVGVEVVDPVGPVGVGDVLEGRPLDGRAEFHDAVPEEEPRQVGDRQLARVDDRVERRGDDRVALRHVVGEDEVEDRLGMHALDGVGQRRGLGQVVGRDAREDVHGHSFAPGWISAAGALPAPSLADRAGSRPSDKKRAQGLAPRECNGSCETCQSTPVLTIDAKNPGARASSGRTMKTSRCSWMRSRCTAPRRRPRGSGRMADRGDRPAKLKIR